MQIKAYSMIESLFILLLLSLIGTIYSTNKPVLLRKNEIISEIIHTQFLSYQYHERYDFTHPIIKDLIWFNRSGNVNQANTIQIENTNESFTIMLHTGRIHE